MAKISLKKLLETGAHFGHQSRRWSPKMEGYLHGIQDGVHVFDLTKTKEALEEALSFLEEAASEGKTILFLGTKKQVKRQLEDVAKNVGQPYVSERWLGGTITNFGQIKKSIDKLHEMKEEKEAGEYKKFTKKERAVLDREIERLERFFGGMSDLEDKPDVLFIVDTKKESGALREAVQEGIKTVAILDSNCDPTEVDYPIPMNDDATKALSYVMSLVEDSLAKGGKKKDKKDAKKKKEEEKKEKKEKEE